MPGVTGVCAEVTLAAAQVINALAAKVAIFLRALIAIPLDFYGSVHNVRGRSLPSQSACHVGTTAAWLAAGRFLRLRRCCGSGRRAATFLNSLVFQRDAAINEPLAGFYAILEKVTLYQ